MRVSLEELAYVAKLAHLALPEDAAAQNKLLDEMESIINLANQLALANTENVAPTAHVLPLENVWRKDEVKNSLTTEQLLQNAPAQVANCFKVPAAITNANEEEKF